MAKAAEIDPKIIQYTESKDPALLAEIVEEYMPFIKRAVSGTNPSFPVLDREDMVQYGVIGFIGALNRFDPARGVPFKAWVSQRVRGAALDAVRKISSTARTRNVQMVRLTDVYSSDEEELSELRLSESASPALREALLQLPLQPAVVLLLSIHGLPPPQIAKIIGKAESTVYQDRVSALESLRTELAGKLDAFV